MDILRALDIEPDGMIGHSVGELACAYADGCFTAEEMILAAYARGRASVETQLPDGMMAAVGISYKAIKGRLPHDVDVACHNSAESCTISGPTKSVLEFVDKLKSDGVFAKAVNVANISFHSRYIQPAAPTLLKYLKEVRAAYVLCSPYPADGFDVFNELFDIYLDHTEPEKKVIAMVELFYTRIGMGFGFGTLLFGNVPHQQSVEPRFVRRNVRAHTKKRGRHRNRAARASTGHTQKIFT